MTWISGDPFRQLVSEALDRLPRWVLERIDNVEFLIEDDPPAGQSGLLGLYSGVPLSQRGTFYSNVLPDSITFFRRNIERESGGSDERLREVIFHTLTHELAHHFGISDERLLEIDAY